MNAGAGLGDLYDSLKRLTSVAWYQKHREIVSAENLTILNTLKKALIIK